MRKFIRREFIFLLILTISGGLLRYYNINWDEGLSFHPDERNIANSVSQINFFNQMNPHFFAYGGFLIYLYRLMAEIQVKITGDINWVYHWGYINIIGRTIQAFFATLTIPLFYILARKAAGKTSAFISSILFTFTVSLIQTAHYAITETLLVLSIVLISLLSIRLLKNFSVKNTILCAIVCGISIASKIIAISFLLIPLMVFLLSVKTSKKYVRTLKLGILFLAVTSAFFAIFSPYAFLDYKDFISSLKYESAVAIGSLPVPYTLQFDKTTPYIFQIKNFFWQLGLAALLWIPGLIIVLITSVKKRNFKILILIPFLIFYFLYVGQWHTKFLRYMIPIIPLLIFFSGYFLAYIYQKNMFWGKILIVLFCFSNILWSFAFFSIYTRQQTRIAASEWIYDNIAAGSKILGEHWDDELPVPLQNHNPGQYKIQQLTIYNPDNENKRKYYAEKLASSDYIIINSRRLYGTIMYLPEKYPLTSKYYKLLFSGDLGYKEIAEFTSYPQLLGIMINDDKSEETFQVYDHPKVIIFQNIKRYEYNQLLDIIK